MLNRILKLIVSFLIVSFVIVIGFFMIVEGFLLVANGNMQDGIFVKENDQFLESMTRRNNTVIIF